MIAPTSAPSNGREVWLDGLRGVAAVIVAFFHLTTGSLKSPYRSFWDEPASENRKLYQLPPFRIFFSGQAMVDIFFIVSGYSIAIGIIKIRNAENGVDFYRKLTSATFRRVFRLIIPVLFMSAVSHVCFYFNLFYWPFPENQGCGSNTKPLSNPLPHIACFIRSNWGILHLQTGQDQTLNDHLWTIPVEISGSFAVYLSILAFSMINPTARIGAIVALGLRYLWIGMPEFFAFYVGYFFAEVDVLTMSLPLLPMAFEKSKQHATAAKALASAKYVGLAIGLYLISVPVRDPAPPDWFYLHWFESPYWLWWEIKMRSWHTIGATLVIYAMRNVPSLRRPFETQVAQFLGFISFSLYLLHQTVYRVLLTRLQDWISRLLMGMDYWQVYSEDHPVGLFVVWTITTAILGALMAVLARWMSRSVDQEAVRWAHHVEKLCRDS